jgi:hypothetical protein
MRQRKSPPGKRETRKTKKRRKPKSTRKPKARKSTIKDIVLRYRKTGIVPKKWKPEAYRAYIEGLEKSLGPKLWLRQGKFSRFTPTVKQFAARFPGKDLKTVQRIAAALRDPRIMRYEQVPYSKITDVYARRNADRILIDKVIYGLTLEAQGKHHLTVHGCVDYSNVLATVLRAKGIPCKFVRIVDHSVVHFEMEGKQYVADCTKQNARQRVRRNSGKLLETNKIFKEQKQLSEGLDSNDVGLHSIDDFYKYADKRRK